MFSYEKNEKIVDKIIRECICERRAYDDNPYNLKDYFQKHLFYAICFDVNGRWSDVQGAVKLLGTNNDKTKAQFILVSCNEDPQGNYDYDVYEKLDEFLSDYDEKYKFVADLIHKDGKEYAEGVIKGVGRYRISPSWQLGSGS